jgi:hypothetical protein
MRTVGRLLLVIPDTGATIRGIGEVRVDPDGRLLVKTTAVSGR